jgi:hypothetical protein
MHNIWPLIPVHCSLSVLLALGMFAVMAIQLMYLSVTGISGYTFT